MKIKIDYCLWKKDTSKLSLIRHMTLTETDILEFALEKYKENNGESDFERYRIEASIDEITI